MNSTGNPSRRLRRFTLGVALAALALLLSPVLLEQPLVDGAQAGLTPRLEQRAAALQGAPAAPGPASAAQDGATQAPAAFSDALAAAPAGAQCNMEAHSCGVPSVDDAQALSATETTVAFGFSQTLRGANHNERL